MLSDGLSATTPLWLPAAAVPAGFVAISFSPITLPALLVPKNEWPRWMPAAEKCSMSNPSTSIGAMALKPLTPAPALVPSRATRYNPVPDCVVPSINTLLVIEGSADAGLIVGIGGSGMLKWIVSFVPYVPGF